MTELEATCMAFGSSEKGRLSATAYVKGNRVKSRTKERKAHNVLFTIITTFPDFTTEDDLKQHLSSWKMVKNDGETR